ncbi:MAG: DUF4271 domain-containing protein [Cytophagaceae bacterium]|nr:DUF4271 domain-containing protein [Cytophagaceae bacterium]
MIFLYQKSKSCLLFILIIFVCCSQIKAGDSLDNTVVKDLSSEWLVYNKEYKTYFPYFKNSDENAKSLSILIDLNKYQYYNLNFKAAPGLSFFVDQKIFYKNTSDNIANVTLNIKKLIASDFSGGKQVITFYHSKGQLPVENIFVGINATRTVNTAAGNFAVILPRYLDGGKSLFVIYFILILSLFAFIKNRYPKKFYEFSGFSNIIPALEENIVFDFLSIPIILFVFINTLAASLILFLIKDNKPPSESVFLNIFYEKPVIGILIMTGFFFLIFILKYIYLKFIGWIYNINDFVKVQFFELLRVTLKLNLLLLALALIMNFSGYFDYNLDLNWFIYVLLLALTIVLLRVGYLTFRLSGFRNVYLFSYLCTTEILPLIIIVKLILF